MARANGRPRVTFFKTEKYTAIPSGKLCKLTVRNFGMELYLIPIMVVVATRKRLTFDFFSEIENVGSGTNFMIKWQKIMAKKNFC
jgi:hypothetical protein